MGRMRFAPWLVVSSAAVIAAAVPQIDRGPVVRVEQSTDVAWLERIASAASFADELQRSSRIGLAKSLRTAAYARLGELGTAESLAAIARVEQVASNVSQTPATVRAAAWPTVGWHMGDMRVVPLAETNGPDGTTYAIVVADLLGRGDFFVISSRTPADRDSWSRPRLVAPYRYRGVRDAALTLRSPGTLVLAFTQTPPPARGIMEVTPDPGPTAPKLGPVALEIVLDAVLRDADGDGWTDREEERLGLDPHRADTDGDGLIDGGDTCPLYPLPKGGPTEDQAILQKAIFAAFGLTGSRQLLLVTPGTPTVHVVGYGGPILYGHPIPKDGTSGGPYVSWKIVRKSAEEASVELTDWEGTLAAGGQTVRLRKLAGNWVVVARQTTWVS